MLPRNIVMAQEREVLTFGYFARTEEPAYEVFQSCLKIVFDLGDGTTEYLERLGSQARLVYLLWCFDGEVYNGGFDQLFFNSLGNHCLEILVGLKKVGAVDSAMLLQKAITWFPESNPSPSRAERWKQLEPYQHNSDYSNALNDLDFAFYQYEANLASLLHQYVRENTDAGLYA